MKRIMLPVMMAGLFMGGYYMASLRAANQAQMNPEEQAIRNTFAQFQKAKAELDASIKDFNAFYAKAGKKTQQQLNPIREQLMNAQKLMQSTKFVG